VRKLPLSDLALTNVKAIMTVKLLQMHVKDMVPAKVKVSSRCLNMPVKKLAAQLINLVNKSVT
jgi:hypothetical protein